MRMGEAWRTAAERTGVDAVGAEVTLGFGLALTTLEILWWCGLALVLKRRLLAFLHADDS